MIGKNSFILLILLGVLSCSGSNLIESKNYKTSKKRTDVLKQYFKVRSEIIDARFRIYDVNINNRSIPGPTDRDFKVIIKVAPEKIQNWEEPDNISTAPVPYEWAHTLLQEDTAAAFQLTGPAKHYVSPHKEMTIFTEAGVIVIHIEQH